jgi:hypothetical protein
MEPLVFALLVVLAVLVAVALAAPARRDAFVGAAPGWHADMTSAYPYCGDAAWPGPGPAYRTAEVDPIVTGQLYAGARGERRPVYAAPLNSWGLHETNVGLPGEVGVDVGPLEAGEVADAGIPANWRLPSDPLVWRAAPASDHYDYATQGLALAAGRPLVPLREPDHDPLIGGDEG